MSEGESQTTTTSTGTASGITTGTQTAPATPPVVIPPQVVTPPVVQTPATQAPTDTRDDVRVMKEQNEALVAKLDQLLTERYEGIVTELKNSGITDPDKIVHGLPVEQKIAVLSQMKTSIVKKAPLASTTSEKVPPSGQPSKTDVQNAVEEVLGELGYSMEEYKKLHGE